MASGRSDSGADPDFASSRLQLDRRIATVLGAGARGAAKSFDPPVKGKQWNMFTPKSVLSTQSIK
jgi:hypothetical protein